MKTAWFRKARCFLRAGRCRTSIRRHGFRPLKIEVLSKLLAFIDGAGLVDTTYAESDKWVLLSPEFRAIWQDRKRCEYWFCSKLLRLLRPSIRYWRCYEKARVTGWLAIYSLSQPAATRWECWEKTMAFLIPIFVVCAAERWAEKRRVNYETGVWRNRCWIV